MARISVESRLLWKVMETFGAATIGVGLGYQMHIASVILESALIYLLWVSSPYFISLLKQEPTTI